MKRSMILAAALSFALLCLSGCSRTAQEEPSLPQQSAPTQSQPVEPVPPQPAQAPAAPEVPPAQEPEVQQPPYQMQSGVWLAVTDAGYSNYYYFNAQEQSGSYVSLEYGLGFPFSYTGSDSELVFQMDGRDADVCAAVEHIDSQSFTLVWEDSLPETLTFVSEGTLDDFHFFSNDALTRLSAEHYARFNEHTPGMSAAMTNDDNTVTVQLYDNLGDHNSIAAWYIVDRFTATGTNLSTGEEIDLLEEEEVPPAQETPVEDEPLPDEPALEEAPIPEESAPEQLPVELPETIYTVG